MWRLSAVRVRIATEEEAKVESAEEEAEVESAEEIEIEPSEVEPAVAVQEIMGRPLKNKTAEAV